MLPLDYNYYVDDILQISPPYHSENKELLKELVESPDIMKVYKAYKNKDKIIVKENGKKASGFDKLPVLEKLDSLLSPLRIAQINLQEDSMLNRSETSLPVFVSPDLFEKIDNLCSDYGNFGDFTPIYSPPIVGKRNSLLNRLANF